MTVRLALGNDVIDKVQSAYYPLWSYIHARNAVNQNF